MDPITAAIVAALAAGATAGLTDTAKQAVADAFGGLKGLLQHRFGAGSEVAKAVEGLEARPASDARKALLQEEVKAAGADHDAELLKAAQAVLNSLQAQPGGAAVVQQATGSNIAQAAGGSTASVNVNTPKD